MMEMTLERASEMVSALREMFPAPDTKATDLFDYFVDTLHIVRCDDIAQFAEMCGFQVATEVAIEPMLFVPWEEAWKEIDFLKDE